MAPGSIPEKSAAASAGPEHGGYVGAAVRGIQTSGSEQREVRQEMEISVPLVVILGAIAWIAWRYMGLRAWHLVVCLLFGFFLAATSAAPEIRQVVTVLVESLSEH
ncbi:hypothetical protein ACFQ07_03050 [Actinomadura adrarensis]|uniref:Uncharacterized protein n=1 Tax=Actinomadura adrarensis TaxID=1819600 RepID=A0ABW3CBZ0_9ACTN